MTNPYIVLGVKSNATLDEIRSAYLRAAQQHHPDRQKSCCSGLEWEDANRNMAEINIAWQILKDPVQKARYDARIRDEEEKQKQRAEEQQHQRAEQERRDEEEKEKRWAEKKKRTAPVDLVWAVVGCVILAAAIIRVVVGGVPEIVAMAVWSIKYFALLVVSSLVLDGIEAWKRRARAAPRPGRGRRRRRRRRRVPCGGGTPGGGVPERSAARRDRRT